MHAPPRPQGQDAIGGLLPWLPRISAMAAVGVGLALAAPLNWSAVAAGLGLLGLLALGLFGAMVIHALPLLLQKLENRLLAPRKAEARNNPIEQLQNDCVCRELRLVSFRQALVQIGGQIENMRQMFDECRQTDPAHVLDWQERAVRKMTQFYEVNLGRLEQAHTGKTMPILKSLPCVFHLSATVFSASALIGCSTRPSLLGSSGFI